MKADTETAAIKATETLIKHRVTTTPVDPIPIIKSLPGTIVLSFSEMADTIGIDRTRIIGNLVTEHHDAVTAVNIINGKVQYCVAYNQRLPFHMMQRSLARELGHIILGHDGSRPEDVRIDEALCFARYLLFPRALIHSIIEAGIPFTIELFGALTGCYERCVTGLRNTPGVCVPPELNRLVRDQFAPFVSSLVDFHKFIGKEDHSGLVNLGSYLDNYSE